MASRSTRRSRKARQGPAERSRTVPRTNARRTVGPRQRPARLRGTSPALAPLARRRYVWLAAAGAVLVAGSLIGLSVLSGRAGSTAPASSSGSGLAGVASTASLFRGVPQHGNVLGSANAPLQLIEYADPQCPYCAQYARDVLPTLVREYVRPGKVQLVYRGLWFLGPDSGTALRTATAAGSENRMWNVLELMYRNQGPENGWVTDDLLRSIVTAAGADASRVFGARDGDAVAAKIDGWGSSADVNEVRGTPAFFIGRRRAATAPVPVTALEVSEFRAALDRALQQHASR